MNTESLPGKQAGDTPSLIQVRNPRSGKFDYSFRPPTAEALAARCRALREAQPAWQEAGIEARVAAMQRLAELLASDHDALLEALRIDTARSGIAAAELQSVVGNIRRWCDAAPHIMQTENLDSRLVPTLQISHQLVPYPLVGVISPWNFPLALSFIDAIPALLAGCAVAVKPSEVTPRFAPPLRALLDKVPEVAAVLDIIEGAGETGAGLIGEVDALCFTGSVATGRKVAVAAAERFIPAFLELGGKDPAIVLASADLEQASEAILRSSCLSSGQACLSVERSYVERPVHDELVELLVAKAGRTGLAVAGSEHEPIAAMIFKRQAEIIDEQLDDAVAKGAVIRCGGKSREIDGGYYVPPTVVTAVDHSMRIMTEETFGPVMPVMAFDSVDEAVRLANDTRYGLSGAVFAGTLAEARAIAEQVNAGGISLNDAGLTRETFEAEKNSFGYSGMGGSRHGDAGLLRFFRKKVLLGQRGTPLTLEEMNRPR